MDKIEITGLKINTIIGTYPWEKAVMQPIFLDLSMDYDLTAAGKSDNINETIDYAALCDSVSELVSNRSFQLIECLAETISDFILKNYPIKSLQIRVNKPTALENAHNVSILMQRKK